MNSQPRRRLLYVISYHHACNDGALIALVALLPILIVELELSYSEVGLLGLGLLITVVVQLLVGRLTDRAFSRYLLEIGALLMALSFMMIVLVSNFIELFAAVIAMRIGASFYHPVGITWITREYAGGYLDTTLGIQSGIGNLGVILSLATSGFLGEAFGWKVPCMLWVALNLVAVILGIATTGQHASLRSHVRPQKPSSISKTISRVAWYAAPIAAGGALYSVTTYYGPINLTAESGWGVGAADFVFAIWLAVGTISSYMFGRISAKLGRRRVVTIGYGGSMLCLVILFLTSAWYLIIPTLVVYGGLMFLTYPALFAMVSEATDDDERGTAFGMVFAFQLGGAASLVYVCGLIADAYDDPSLAFLVSAAFTAVALLMFVMGRNRLTVSTET